MNGMRMFTQAMGKAMGQMSIIRHTTRQRDVEREKKRRRRREREKEKERGEWLEKKHVQVECVTGRLKIWQEGKRYKLSETLSRCSRSRQREAREEYVRK